jgi:hypothetical protein
MHRARAASRIGFLSLGPRRRLEGPDDSFHRTARVHHAARPNGAWPGESHRRSSPACASAMMCLTIVLSVRSPRFFRPKRAERATSRAVSDSYQSRRNNERLRDRSNTSRSLILGMKNAPNSCCGKRAHSGSSVQKPQCTQVYSHSWIDDTTLCRYYYSKGPVPRVG